MGKTIEEKILDIKVRYEDAIRGIAKYQGAIDAAQQKQKELKSQLKENKITQAEYNAEMAASKQVISENKDAVRILEKEIQNNIKAEKEQKDSLVALRASLSNLTRQYDEMSEAERKNATGEDLKIHINAITDKIKDAEGETQRFYRNVGNYQKDFEKVLQPLKQKLDDVTNSYLSMSAEERKGAEGEEMRNHIEKLKKQLDSTSEAGGKFRGELLNIVGVQNGMLGSISNSVGGIKSMSGAFMAGKAAVSAFGKQLLALLANPIVLILAGIAAVVMLVAKAINSSEEASNRWSIVIAPLTRALNFLLNTIQTVAGAILSVVEAGGKMLGWISSMLEKVPLLGGMFKQINEANKEAINLAKEKIAIEQQAREDEVQNAKDAFEVSKLRTLAKDKEKYTAEERLKFIREANKLEEGQAERNVALAERKLEALRLESEWAQNNAEANKELAKLEADVLRARKEYFDKTRELKEQENSLINEDKAARAQEAKERISRIKEQREKEREAIRQSEDALLSLIKNESERRRAQIKTSYNREIEDLKRKLTEEENLTKKAKDAILSIIRSKENEKDAELKKLGQEEIRSEIEKRQKLIETQLAGIKAGTEQEFQLKMQQIIAQRDMELSNTELTEQMKLAIRNKYNKQLDDLTAQHHNDIVKKQEEAIKVRFETELAQAYGNEQEQLRIKLEYKKAELDNLQQLEGESMEAFNLRKKGIENAYIDAKRELADKEVQIEQTKYQAAADITNALSTLADAASEHSKGLAMASKVLALAEIAINTGKAIAAGVAQAQSVPFPGNIAAIATTISTVLSNIAVATKTVKSAKFAEGGLVTGPGTGTSDSISAQLSNGESVITARATEMFSPILSSLNMMGGGVPINITTTSNQTLGEDMLARAVAKGMMMAPSPVISVQEFTSVANRVKYLEDLGSL